MRIYHGQHEAYIGMYDSGDIKDFIEFHGDFDVELTEQEMDDIHSMFHDSDPDDDIIQNRWMLLLYIKVVGRIGFQAIRDDILNYYSLEEEEYDITDNNPAKCHIIHDLFTESSVYKLTRDELWILENAIYQYDQSYDQYLAHVQDEEILRNIRARAIPVQWVVAERTRLYITQVREILRRHNSIYVMPINPAA